MRARYSLTRKRIFTPILKLDDQKNVPSSSSHSFSASSCRTAHYRHSRPETGLDIAECRSGSGELDGDIGLRQTLRCKFRLFPRIHRKKYRMAPVDKHTFYLVPHRAVSYDDCFHAFLSSSGKDRYCAKVLKTSRCTAYPNGIFPTVRQHHGSLRYSATERTSGV